MRPAKASCRERTATSRWTPNLAPGAAKRSGPPSDVENAVARCPQKWSQLTRVRGASFARAVQRRSLPQVRDEVLLAKRIARDGLIASGARGPLWRLRFAPRAPGGDATSGLRDGAEVGLYADLHAAIADGIPLVRSTSGVINAGTRPQRLLPGGQEPGVGR